MFDRCSGSSRLQVSRIGRWIVATAMALSLLLSAAGAAAVSEDDGTDQLSAVLLGSDPSGVSQLAVRWTGDPSARLSAWVDVPGDPRSDGHQVLDQVVLDEGMKLFSIQGPPHYRGLVGPTLPIRFQLSRDGHALWTRHENVDWIVDKASPLTHPAQSATSEPEEACQWLDGFHGTRLSAPPIASVVFDDGTGPALYVGGHFKADRQTVLNHVGKWDGEQWQPLGGGVNAPVSALEVFDHGDGPVLIAGGLFSEAGGLPASHIAQWNGATWSPLGAGTTRSYFEAGVGGNIHALEVFDDGNSQKLIAAGEFTEAGGIAANRIAQWDGTAWSSLGLETVTISSIFALAQYDLGDGPRLAAGGSFSLAGGRYGIASWDGHSWSSLGTDEGGDVYALEVFDPGSGPVLVAGGYFSLFDDHYGHIAQWDGESWSSLGAGTDSFVFSLEAIDFTGEPLLIASGWFSDAGKVGASRIAQWDGESWTAFEHAIEGAAYFLETFDAGSGPELYAFGGFSARVARWDGAVWESMIEKTGRFDLATGSLALLTDGEASAVVASARIWDEYPDDVDRWSHGITRWDGDSLSVFAAGFDNGINSIAEYHHNGRPTLVVGGDFLNVDDVSVAYIAQWDGAEWAPLGLGVDGRVEALSTFDDGSGRVLVAGGAFSEAGGRPAARIAQWDGTSWSSIGSVEHDRPGLTKGGISRLLEFETMDDNVLVASGIFTEIGGVSANGLAAWDGTAWSALDPCTHLGSGAGKGGHGALATYHDEGTPILVTSCYTKNDGAEPLSAEHQIVQWDGTTWSPLGSSFVGRVFTLAGFNTENGDSMLIVGGTMTEVNGSDVNYIASWDGTSWSHLSSGADDFVLSSLISDVGRGPVVTAAGFFELVGGKASAGIGMYACPHLPVTLTQYTDEVVAGGTVTYGLTIENGGMLDATAIPILAEFAEPLAACRWSSTGSGGATGYTSGTGSALDDVLDLPIDGSVHYVISCAVSASATGEVQLAATASVPGVGITTSATEVDIVVDRPNVSTLILAHPARMMEQMGATLDELESLMSGLDAFAAHTNVDGLVLDVGFHDELAELYAAWDAEIENSDSEPVPDTANHVLFGHEGSAQNDDGKEGLHDLVRSVLEDRPDIDHVMLIGDDRIIPMARIQDRTYEPSELDYHDVDHESSTVGHALAWDQYLSDDPIGVDGPVTARPLQTVRRLRLIPDVAVGRLVETPTEIRHSLETFLELDGRIDLTGLDPDHRVLVAGYDFLVDSATQIREHWNSRFGWPDDEAASAPVNGQLIGRTWGLGSAEEREDALLEHWTGFGSRAYRVMSLNGHANHYEEGVPGQNLYDIRGLAASEIAALSPELGGRGSLIYAVGCHGGLPVPGSDPDDEDKSLDLPQTLLGRGALGYLANSGFGWGLHHHVGYSEKLMLLFTEELAQPGTVTVGDAMLRAKQRYYHEDASWNPFDVKTSLQWTLFGFPMVKVETGIAETREADSRRGLTDAAAQTGGCLDLPDHLICDAAVSFMSDFGTFEKYRTGGDTPLVDVEGCPPPADGEPEGCYYALNGLTVTEGGLPIEPVLIDDSRRAGTSQHGVLWTGGRYEEEAGWVPSMAQPVSSHGPLPLAGPLPKTTFIRPRGRASGGATDSSQQCTPTDTELNSLVFVPAELIFDDALEPTIHRLHTEVGLETFYFNNRVDGVGNCDRLGPQFDSGPYHSVDGDTVLFSVAVDDDFVAGEPRLGVWRVVVVWDHAAESRWKPIELTFDEASGRWIGELERPGDADSIVYFLQAVDVRGNVSWAPFEAPDRGTSAQDVESGLPRPIEVILPPAGLLFWDDFETADTSRWSSAN